MSELQDARFMAIRIKLRQYYNEVMEVEEDEELDVGEKEKALMQLDDTYAERIASL